MRLTRYNPRRSLFVAALFLLLAAPAGAGMVVKMATLAPDGSVWDSATTSLYGPPPGFVPGGPNPHSARPKGATMSAAVKYSLAILRSGSATGVPSETASSRASAAWT